MGSLGEGGGGDGVGAVIVIIDSSDEEEIQVREGSYSIRQQQGENGSLSQAVDLSPGFRNAAAMAGWDDEALLAVWDCEAAATPDKSSGERGDRKRDVRTPGQATTPASLNRVHRKPRRPIDSSDVNLERLTIHDGGDGALVRNLQKKIDRVGEDENGARVGNLQKKIDRVGQDGRSGTSQEKESVKNEIGTDKSDQGDKDKEQGGAARPACLDQLRDELSCAVCLDVCFKPSTTSCGHSFCRSCLQSAVSKCGLRCPKCRQAIKEQGAINVVLWNTIQILFPDETAKRSQAKREEEDERTSRAQRSNQNSRQVSVDRSRPIGNFRRVAAPFRAPSRRSSDRSSSATPIDLESRRQQEELDRIVAERLQEDELRSSSSSSSAELFGFHRRLRRAHRAQL
ncbi:putative E3 ubiquitin-protein ligase RING1a [Selaginella moellendorffii]|uniref:putative E3 ubiquitin-protein ligase RING1a n=1 Tax=Selaginella moellendorffii TaxID=88036 RepID=UPI000D1CFEAE|nr:putative E3 ubiquitin-protein ligase RING1a [Selaginella moellendorffii]|eukprot:XP_024538950.1 putative E3 ubiquitin-protein ligase RING1a [Selaginella moellendorffii]